MKRCPQCGREYDVTMSFCLDDGGELLYGPAGSSDEPRTEILSGERAMSDPQTLNVPSKSDTVVARPGNTGSGSRIIEENSPTRTNKLLAVLGIGVVILGSAFLGYRYFTVNAKQIDSIAVMPFVNEGGNADLEYLSDGMTETLISSLSQLPNLNVKGRSSVFRYKGRDMDAKTLGKELGVQAVLYGRVIPHNDQLTLSLELLDALTENVIWSGKYDRKQADVVSLQSDIARDVSGKLKFKLSGAETAKVEKEYTADPEAYKLYLQGRFYWNKRNEADLKKSIEFFEQAIARDPGYALAYSGLGAVYQVMPGYTLDPPPAVVYPEARRASQKALEIDPTLAEPHATIAVVLHEYEWNHGEAEKEFKRAIELDPKYPSSHQWYGNFLLNVGRSKEGIAELETARELDPLSPIINANLARGYRADHRYDEAVAQYKKTLEILPNFQVAQFHLNKTYVLMGMYEEAIDQTRKNLLSSGLPQSQVNRGLAQIAEIQNAFHTSGPNGFWAKVLESELEEARVSGQDLDPYELAGYQLGAGKKEEALDSLDKAFARGRGVMGILWLKAEPTWDPLRAEPRFKELLRKMGLPE